MVKDQDYLKKTATFCIDLAKKLGATDVTAAIGHSISETVNFRKQLVGAGMKDDFTLWTVDDEEVVTSGICLIIRNICEF